MRLLVAVVLDDPLFVIRIYPKTFSKNLNNRWILKFGVTWCQEGQIPSPDKNKIKAWDTAIPLLGIYPEKTIIQKDTRTPMFIQHHLQ